MVLAHVFGLCSTGKKIHKKRQTISSHIPDASQLPSITQEKEYTVLSVREDPKSPPTCLKVKNFTKKYSQEEHMGWGNGVPLFWWYKTLEITGEDIHERKFTIVVVGRRFSIDIEAAIRAELTWSQSSKLKAKL
jgi:hypothetical protein